MSVYQRLLALGDIALLVGLYLENNKSQVHPDDCWNSIGFEVENIESQKGWSFQTLPKPTLEQLENLFETVQLQIEWENLRAERNRRLTACDWTQVFDAPVTTTKRSQWQTYRKSLRDLPAHTQDPRNPNWPLPPT